MSNNNSSFGAEEPTTPGLSDVDTPIMSQENKMILNTPPPGSYDATTVAMPCFESPVLPPPTLLNTPPVDQTSQYTPSEFANNDMTCPSWHPPDSDEVKYTNEWNNSHDNRHHYLQAAMAQDDSSTIGSKESNDSFNVSFNASNNKALRPRGFSLCSHGDTQSVGSCTHPSQQRGGHNANKNHRRHPSLPTSFFSSTQHHHGSGQSLFQRELNKRYLNALQSTTTSTPYELHSHHNISQVKADGAMAGLDGVLLDLYMVDRAVDCAAAKMLATKGAGSAQEQQEERGRRKGKRYTSYGDYEHILGTIGDIGNAMRDDIPRKEDDTAAAAKQSTTSSSSSPQKPRKTSLGTLTDIQCILELYRVDRNVDRFKQDLQMPQFSEEEAWESSVWKELRRTDVEMEEYARKMKEKESKATETEVLGQGPKDPQYQFDLSDDEDEAFDRWNDQELGGEGIYLSAESFLTDYDAYAFFDPHETTTLQANSYQSSQVSASINDDLGAMIDLLRIDAEIDGASRRHHEMELIRPLLDVDREVDKVKERSEVMDMWVGDLRDLYLVDIEVDGAKKRYTKQSQKNDIDSVSSTIKAEAKKGGNEIKEQDPLSPVVPTKQHTDEEVKEMLSRHIPKVPLEFCPTSPELVALQKPSLGTSDFNALPPPSVPIISSPQEVSSTRRAIFSTKEKTAAPVASVVPQTTAPKRSIFSSKEKTTAASKCAFQRGVMMPGTTTVVAKGGDMIDDIPIGKVL